MTEGYIKIHRQIFDWEWYGDPNTVVLWLHILLSANYEDKTWRGVQVMRGEFYTSLSNLSKQTGLSIKQIRTALGRLEKGKQIVKQTANKWTKITVCNYASYQDNADTKGQTNGKQEGNETASERATTKEIKNIRKQEYKENTAYAVKEKRSVFVPPSVEDVQSYADSIGFDLDAEHFINYYSARGWELSKGRKVKDWKACVRTWRDNQKKPGDQEHTLFGKQEEKTKGKQTFTFVGTPRG